MLKKERVFENKTERNFKLQVIYSEKQAKVKDLGQPVSGDHSPVEYFLDLRFSKMIGPIFNLVNYFSSVLSFDSSQKFAVNGLLVCFELGSCNVISLVGFVCCYLLFLVLSTRDFLLQKRTNTVRPRVVPLSLQ